MCIRAIIFSSKIRKEGHPNNFVDQKYSVILTKPTFFLPNMGLTAGDFLKKTWKKMTWEHSVFDRMNVFWQNMDLRAVSSLKNRRITNINWVWEQLFFSKKSGKKGILLTFMAHKIVSFWQNIRFLTKYEARWETPGYPHTFLW